MSTSNLTSLMSDMVVFVKVVETGSFSEASRQLGYTPSAVSRSIARLEKGLGTRVLQRTTRKLRLSDSGQAIYEHARDMLSCAQAAMEISGQFQTEPEGQIRLSVPKAVGHFLIHPHMPDFLVAHPKTGVKTFQEFVARVKKEPGAFTYGSSGIGSTHHLTMEAMKADLGLSLVHVPFRGSSQSVPALVGGQVDVLFAALPSMQGFVKSGQVVLLASNAAKRSASVPDVPSINETIPGFDFSVSVGVLARTGTPSEISKRISDEIAQIVKLPDVVEKFQTAGIESVGANGDAYRKVIELENQAMAKAGKHAELKAE